MISNIAHYFLRRTFLVNLLCSIGLISFYSLLFPQWESKKIAMKDVAASILLGIMLSIVPQKAAIDEVLNKLEAKYLGNRSNAENTNEQEVKNQCNMNKILLTSIITLGGVLPIALNLGWEFFFSTSFALFFIPTCLGLTGLIQNLYMRFERKV